MKGRCTLEGCGKVPIPLVGGDHVKGVYLTVFSNLLPDSILELSLSVGSNGIDQAVWFIRKSMGITDPFWSVRLTVAW